MRSILVDQRQATDIQQWMRRCDVRALVSVRRSSVCIITSGAKVAAERLCFALVLITLEAQR